MTDLDKAEQAFRKELAAALTEMRDGMGDDAVEGFCAALIRAFQGAPEVRHEVSLSSLLRVYSTCGPIVWEYLAELMPKREKQMVGVRGFEPPASTSRT